MMWPCHKLKYINIKINIACVWLYAASPPPHDSSSPTIKFSKLQIGELRICRLSQRLSFFQTRAGESGFKLKNLHHIYISFLLQFLILLTFGKGKAMPIRTFPTQPIKNPPTKCTDIIAKIQNEIHFLKILVLTPPSTSSNSISLTKSDAALYSNLLEETTSSS